MLDLHTHILPGLDDGPRSWAEALEMARLAAADGIRGLAATPHLYRHRRVYQGEMNTPDRIGPMVQRLREELSAAGIDLQIFPGCEAPLCPELLDLLQAGQVLILNDRKRHIFLEMPDTVIPPATEDLVFRLNAVGIVPILTHPERNAAFQEMLGKLGRLLRLDCLAQITAASLTGGFGRRAARFAQKLVQQGYVRLVASDAHDARHRPPQLSPGIEKLARLVGESKAWDMVTVVPKKILQGMPV
jgi:protein-tyrosine phosphatase